MFKYFPHTENDLREMKEKIGIKDTKELFKDVPNDVAFCTDYRIPDAYPEIELRQELEKIANLNKTPVVFAGMGAYDHYDPSIIKAITSRQEFLTAYTPYQPEIAQGTLQYIFEFQTMITRLTGMGATNASMYDGSTASAEAMFMAASINHKTKFLVSKTVSPHIAETVKTYAHFKGITVEFVEMENGITSREDLKNKLTDDVSGLLIQKPNYFGIVEDYSGFDALLHDKGAVLIENADISTLAILKTPAEDGADIACGDCQSLGMPLSFGGPYLGYLATKKAYVRRLPGRIVGQSFDKNGKRAYVLTLQAREQHIRREKANSNICSNQSLMALYATVYLSLMGTKGLKEVNELSYAGAHYLYDELIKTNRFFPAFDQPFLKEFVMKTNLSMDVVRKVLADNGIFACVPIGESEFGSSVLVNFAVTEKRTKAQIDQLVALLGGLSC